MELDLGGSCWTGLEVQVGYLITPVEVPTRSGDRANPKVPIEKGGSRFASRAVFFSTRASRLPWCWRWARSRDKTGI